MKAKIIIIMNFLLYGEQKYFKGGLKKMCSVSEVCKTVDYLNHIILLTSCLFASNMWLFYLIFEACINFF